jgi:hypothetical protein
MEHDGFNEQSIDGWHSKKQEKPRQLNVAGACFS